MDAAGQNTAENLSPRAQLLREAEKIVTKDRNSAYGNPEDNFRDIAELWSAYWRGRLGPFTSIDVAMMNTLIKIARVKNNPGHRDSVLDIAGYAACAADIQEGLKRKISGAFEVAQQASPSEIARMRRDELRKD